MPAITAGLASACGSVVGSLLEIGLERASGLGIEVPVAVAVPLMLVSVCWAATEVAAAPARDAALMGS